jgi:hypothetical protein
VTTSSYLDVGDGLFKWVVSFLGLAVVLPRLWVVACHPELAGLAAGI